MAVGIAAALLFLGAKLSVQDSSVKYLLYAGAFTRAERQSIYGFRLNARTGKLLALGLTVAAENPTYFAIHPTGRFLYTVVNRPEATGGVSAYEIDRENGKLTLLNTVSSRGGNTCFVSVSHSGRYALVTNYQTGNVAAYPGHDSLAVFARDAATGKLTSIENISSGGKTPQIFAIDPTGTYLVVVNEGSDNLTAFRIDPDTGRLKFNGEQVSVPQLTYVKFISAAQSRKD